jgi:ABC-type enterobactin transport system permease subunit
MDKAPSDNPNAVVGGASGIGGGALVVAVLDLAGVQVTNPYLATTIAGAVTAVALFIGRNGIVGAFRMIWRGKS